MRVRDGAGRVRAAGGVLTRGEGDGLRVALVHRPRYDDWTLPKGHVDPGEHDLVAAVREVREETGWDAVPGRPLGATDYVARGEPKRVRWWALAARGDAPVAEPAAGEVDEVAWLPAADAARRATLASDRRLLRQLRDGSPGGTVGTTPLALVRHAHAGSRSRWRGDDDDRPLSRRGQDQAEHLAPVLALLHPRRVTSAPPLRCRDTVAPLARRLGLPVESDERLCEGSNTEDVAAALGAVDEALREGRPAVLCSQGGVLPQLLSRVLASHDVRPSRRTGVPTGKPRKGSLTLLHLAAADRGDDAGAGGAARPARVSAVEHLASAAPRYADG